MHASVAAPAGWFANGEKRSMTEGRNAAESEGTVYPLGRYLVLAELGRGGMAEVYLALSRGPNGFNKLVVLKLLRAHLAEDDTFLQMFLAEARLAARLNHANIVQTYEIGVEGGRHCIVMEYLEGRSFAEVEAAKTEEPMALSLGVRVLADTLGGLHHAHELCDVDGRPLGLVHRDVSPHNVFVTYDGQVKLLDFGIAKAADDGARTKTGVFKGKLRYTAPERFAGEESDRRSDIFSVGVMLWQLLTKRRLWAGLNELGVMQQLASRSPIASARSVNPDVPPRLDEICAKALAVSPEDRFRTAAEMADELEDVLAGESVGATTRALGKYMVETFGGVRQQFQRTVDEQIRAAAGVPLDFEPSGSIARLRADALPKLGFAYGAESLSSIPAPPSSSSSSRMISAGGDASSRPPVFAASSAPSDVPPHRARKRGAVALATALLAASALLVSFIRIQREPLPRSSPPTAGAALAPVGTVPPPVPAPIAPAPTSAAAEVAAIPALDAPRRRSAPRRQPGAARERTRSRRAPARRDAPAARAAQGGATEAGSRLLLPLLHR